MPQVRTWEYFEKKLLFLNIKSATGPDLWNYVKKNARINKMCHRSGPVNILRKNFYFQISKVRQVRTCGIMWKNARIYKMCHRSGTCEYIEKKNLLFLNIKSAKGPELWNYVKKCQNILKCTTGPDLWIFWEKTFISKYQKCDRSGPVELREKMLE